MAALHPGLYETKPENGDQTGRYPALAPYRGLRDSHGHDLPRFGVQFFPAQSFELLARAQLRSAGNGAEILG
jgi:hypothetical protein